LRDGKHSEFGTGSMGRRKMWEHPVCAGKSGKEVAAFARWMQNMEFCFNEDVVLHRWMMDEYGGCLFWFS